MQGALVIFIAMVVIGILLYVTDVTYFRHHHAAGESQQKGDSPGSDAVSPEATESPSGEKVKEKPEICCGLHLVCEKTGLAMVGDEIIYYDDEELDRFVGRGPEAYTTEEIEEFREVLLTLLPQDVAPWARSIEQRKIELPSEVRDELIMILSDQ